MLSKKIILWLYYLAIGLLLISLPFSKYTMSVAQFMLVGVFILDGIKKQEYDDFLKRYPAVTRVILFIPHAFLWTFRALVRKFRAFFHAENAPAWIFASIYLMHLAGLIYTTDFHYALKDLRIKFPLFLLPLLLSTTGVIDRKAFRFLVYLFIAAVFTGTLISAYVYLTENISDTREISIFISHIRFSLLIDLAIFQALYLIRPKSSEPFRKKVILAVVILWMISFLIIFAYLTGLIILLMTAAVIILSIALARQGNLYRVVTVTVLAAVFLLAGFYVYRISKDVSKVNPVNFKSLEKKTAGGNLYWHDTTNLQVENGNYVWQYICMDELQEAWNSRSPYAFNGKDKAGQELQHTLIRFLTSKGYRKDAEGVKKMTDKEVAMVENGTASIIYEEKPMLYVRIYKLFWAYQEYRITKNASGHTLMQRFEYWRTAREIVRDNNSWMIGIGTGDLNGEFQRQYDKMGSNLEREFRWRTHNQFLAIFVTFGAAGLLWFLFCLIFPAIRLSKFSDYYFLSFFIIFILSMMTEDTLETQAGVTQFAFFASFYLFSKKFIDLFR